MKPFKKIKGLVAPLDRSNVDTDQIIPKQFLKRVERTGFGKFAFFWYQRWTSWLVVRPTLSPTVFIPHGVRT